MLCSICNQVCVAILKVVVMSIGHAGTVRLVSKNYKLTFTHAVKQEIFILLGHQGYRTPSVYLDAVTQSDFDEWGFANPW